MGDRERIIKLEAGFLKALSHPTRLRILEFLRDGEHCVCELTEHLDLVQANVSQHLAVLKNEGIISSRKEGLKVIYRVDHPEVFRLLELVDQILLEQARAMAGALEGSRSSRTT